MQATVPGTYGTIETTLRHLIESDASYLFRVSGCWDAYPWERGSTVGIDLMRERAAIVAREWTTYLASDVDSDKLGEARGDQGDVFAVSGGVFITQAIHHENEHRAHICTILGARGIEPPDVSAWSYAVATGRSWIVRA